MVVDLPYCPTLIHPKDSIFLFFIWSLFSWKDELEYRDKQLEDYLEVDILDT